MADPAASMALVPEKRQQQRHHGGCVGSILFHLFDWHRRRRLSTKRLPAPPKKTPFVPFSSDDKMPMAKFLMMADDGQGGFQNAKRPPEADAVAPPRRRPVRDAGMRSPGVVARLMGLETMPEASSSRERPRRAVDSACSDASSGSSRHDVNLEVSRRGRPQKLQRTGVAGECGVTGGRIAQEAMQFGRSVVTKARKQQRKFASPKSPRLLSRRNSTRLMEAAVRILEPGLQQRSKAKYALAYRGIGMGNEESSENSTGKSPSEAVGACLGGSFMNCTSLAEVSDLKMKDAEDRVVDYGFVEDVSNKCPSARDMNNVGGLKGFVANASSERGANGLPRPGEVSRRRTRLPSKQEESKRRVDLPGKATFRQSQRILIPDSEGGFRQDMFRRRQVGRDSSAPSTSKDLRVVNKKPAVPPRTRVASKSLESVKDEGRKVAWEKKDMVQRRRPGDGAQLGSSLVSKPNSSLQRNTKQRIVSARGGGHASTSSGTNKYPRNSSMKHAVKSCTIDNKNSNMVSLTFNAPFTHKPERPSSCKTVKEGGSLTTSVEGESTQCRDSIADSSMEKRPSQRDAAFSGDELSVLLEQKIRELNSLHQMAVKGECIGESTTQILEELISALTGDGASYQTKTKHEAGSVQTDSQSICSPEPSRRTSSYECNASKLQVDTEETFARLSSGVESNQPSPTSILEASFSTDGSLSESNFSTSGLELLPYELAEESWGKPQLWDPDPYSTSSVITERTEISPTLDSISIMYGTGGCFGYSEIKPTFAQEVILRTLLLLGHQNPDSGTTIESPIDAVLLDFVELLSGELDLNTNYDSNFLHGKGDIPGRRFVLDCVLENLNSRYCQHWGSSFKCQKKLPLTMSYDELISMIHADVSKCMDLAGHVVDEIIDKELNQSNSIWTEYDDETLGAGEDIEHDIFQALVHEMALDLLPR